MRRRLRDITDPALAQRRARWYRFLACLVWAPIGYWIASGIETIHRGSPLFGPADWFRTSMADPAGPGLNGPGTVIVVSAFLTTMIGSVLTGQVSQRYRQRADDLRAQLLLESIVNGAPSQPYVLYLRPFTSTGAYTTRMRAGKYTSHEDFESLLQSAARAIGPFVALGQTLEWVGGAARIESTESSWQVDAETLMRHARLIVILPGSRPGTLWEIGRLIEQRWIEKTVFIDAANNSRTEFAQEAEWDDIVRLLASHGYRLPGDNPQGQIIAFGTSKDPQLVEPLTTDLRAAFRFTVSLSLGQGLASGQQMRPARRPTTPEEETLQEVVFTHFACSLAHGLIHAWAGVALAPAAIALGVVTQAGPWAGVAWWRRRPRAGALVVAGTMAAAFITGLASHFLIDGTNNVNRVTGESQAMFGLTAVLMLVVEAIGVVVAIKAGLRASSTPSS